MGNFRKNPDKLSYAYLLTPTGVAEKGALTRRFLQRRMAEYEKLREEIEALQLETVQPSQAAQRKPDHEQHPKNLRSGPPRHGRLCNSARPSVCPCRSGAPAAMVLTRTHAELDLTNQAAVQAFFAAGNPTQVYLAAAKVGGIHANNTYPANFAQAFAAPELDWHDHVTSGPTLLRPTDLRISSADPALDASIPGWLASTGMHGFVRAMVSAEPQASADTSTAPTPSE
jgi:hypothetical protein